MCQRMTILTQRQQQPSLTWIQQQTWNVSWYNWVSTQPLTHLLQAHVPWHLKSLEKSTMQLLLK
ncbi:Uncharacterised protein [Mycobacterium tuberculosis]|nr:Uncharacterised protein [Mycobacterium tuberculosis]